MRAKSTEVLLSHRQAVRLLVAMGRETENLSVLSRVLGMSTACTYNSLSLLEGLGLVEKRKTGRVLVVKRTGKGERVARLLEGLYKEFGDVLPGSVL